MLTTGNVARFRNVDLLTPTEHEARVSLQPDSGLVVLAEHLRQQTKVLHVLLTLNKEGLLIHAGPNDSWETDRLPAFCANPMDASGAGVSDDNNSTCLVQRLNDLASRVYRECCAGFK